MSVDLLLRKGLVIVDGRETIRSIGIKTGIIEGIYQIGDEPTATKIVDCEQHYILPGAIDAHVHLRDLMQSDKEDYATGTMAAAAGGVTTVVDMPNSIPPIITNEALLDKIASAKEKRYVNIGFYAGFPKNPSKFDPEIAPHVLGFKVYPHSPLVKGVNFDTHHIRKCLQVALEYDIPLLFHPDSSDPKEKTETIDAFFNKYSCECEVDSLRLFIQAHQEIGGRLHVCHVSCAAAARLIRENRSEDQLTAEVAPHHIFLSGDLYSNSDGTAKMLPPLRSPYDNQAIMESLLRCGIDIVASDHAPHTEAEKSLPFLDAKSGIPGLETTVPLMLTEVFDGRLSWVEYLRVCCSGPARILSLNGKGVLSKGFDADISIISKEEWQIQGKDFFSKAKITPFEGRIVKAKPIMTIVGGKIVYEYGKFQVGAGTIGTVPVRKTSSRNT